MNFIHLRMRAGNHSDSGADGGAILNAQTLTLINVTITTNDAGRNGGGINNGGTLTIKNSVVALNTAAGTAPDARGSGTLGQFRRLSRFVAVSDAAVLALHTRTRLAFLRSSTEHSRRASFRDRQSPCREGGPAPRLDRQSRRC